MSDKIKPSEVSQVLLEQLEGISGGEQFDEVGSVLQVSDGVARIYGLRNAQIREWHHGHCDEPGGRQRWLCAFGYHFGD